MVLFIRILCFSLLVIYASTLSAHSSAYNEFEFIKNNGQWHKNIQYKVQLNEGNIYLEKNRLKFHLADMGVISKMHTQQYKGDWKAAVIKEHTYTATFENANPNCAIVQEDVIGKYYNFYLGNDPTKWHSGVKASHAIRYKSLYDGVDLLVFSDRGSIKYEFHCVNYAASQQIKIIYNGQDDFSLKNGTITIHTSIGEVSEKPPIVYHPNGFENDTILAKYKVFKNELNFDLRVKKEHYNKPIVIDPTLIFSTYSGSTSTNFGFTATHDSEGHLYSGSVVFGVGYPVTTGAFQTTFKGGSGVFGTQLPGTDVAITKYDTNGHKAIYSTYLGGSGDEMPHSLVVNSRDELYIYGSTGSTNFPTTLGCYQDTLNNPDAANSVILEMAVGFSEGSDIFLAAFEPNGKQLLASTYIGGSDNDGVNNTGPYGTGNTRTLNYNYADAVRGEIDIDSDDNIYVVSSTFSSDFPIKGNTAFPTYRGGNQDGIIIKFPPLLDTLVWSSYFGGVFSDAIYSLAFKSNGNLTIAGGTNSPIGFPSSSLPNYTNFKGGRCDGFIAEISKDGQTVNASTYFGSLEYDQIYFVERDRNDFVYVFGQTEDSSSNLIQNAQYFTKTAGQFITKLTPGMDSIVWSTKFGTPNTINGRARPNISPTAFLVDLCNSIYLSGWGGNTNIGRGNLSTLVTNMDTTSDAFQPTTDGSDLYLLVLSDDASRKIYASFFGGSANEHVDGGTSRFDRKGKIYQAVCAGCPLSGSSSGTSDFPTYPNPGAVSNINGAANWAGAGGCNNAVFKMDFIVSAVVAEFQLPRNICSNDSIEIKNLSLEQGSTTYKWFFGNGDSSTLKSPKLFYKTPGNYQILLVVEDLSSCNLNDSLIKNITIVDPKTTYLPNDTICVGDKVVIGTSQDNSYTTFSWSPGKSLDDSTTMQPTAAPTSPTQFQLLLNNTVCTDTNYLFIKVDSLVDAAFIIPDSICIPNEVLVQNTSVLLEKSKIKWDIDNAFQDTLKTPKFRFNKTGVYKIKLTINDSNSCNLTDSITKTVEVKSGKSYQIDPVLICNNNAEIIGVKNTPNYTYNWSSNFGISDSTLPNPLARIKNDTLLRLFINKGVCIDTASQTLLADSIRVKLSNDTVVCSNISAINFDSKHFGTGTNYWWSSNKNFTDTLNTTLTDSIITVNTSRLFENNYYFQSTSSRGCLAIDSTKLLINDFGIEINDSINLCLNDTTTLSVSSLILNDTLDVIWFPYKDILGPNDSTSIQVHPSQSIIYMVDVTTSLKCKAKKEVYVYVSDLDTQSVKITSSRDTIVHDLFSTLKIEPTEYGYTWLPSKGLSSTTTFNTTASPDTTTLYTVEVFDPKEPNCKVSRSYKIVVNELFCAPPYIFLPNTFTPNGDGINDELKLYGKYVETMHLQVFNRWGQMVFESTEQNNGWNGNYKGEVNSSEVFVFQLYVKCIDGQSFKKSGDITLVR